jgi:serine/threonine protein kinase
MTADITVIQPAPTDPGHLDKPGSPDTLTHGTQIEGLEIRDVIGIGGFGIVYKAWDPMLERLVALKEYFPSALAVRTPRGTVKVREERHRSTYESGLSSFVNEARLLAQFDHAALVKVYRFWEMQGTAYMVMPLYQGITLKQYAAQHAEPIANDLLLNWLVALTEALECMHAQQCYHRDISPENIIIQEGTGLPILLDFGAARRAIGSVSQPFTVILKASYAPIEQYAEVPTMTQGPWTDVYALAAVAHYLITGKTPPSSVSRLVNDTYVPLETRVELQFNAEIKQAVDHALRVQVHDRTASMADFRNALQPKPSANLPHVLTSSRTTKRLTMGLVSTALFAVAFAGIALLGVTTSNTPEDVVAKPTVIAMQAEPEISDNPIAPVFQKVLAKAESALSIHMDNPVLKIGEDLLRFQVQSPLNGYVAVYVLSSDQSVIQLLPNVRVPQVTIKANEKILLPPGNEPIQATGPAGSNQFLVIVTEDPREYSQLNMTDHYGFGLIQENSAPLEGVTTCTTTACGDRLAAAWFSVDEVD